jgi:hypothetical protein
VNDAEGLCLFTCLLIYPEPCNGIHSGK